MRTLLSFLVAGLVAYSAVVSNPRVVGTTPTQAIIAYDVSSTFSCTLQVSELSDFSTIVNDVNDALFPNSSRDSRPGNITSNGTRYFVAGKRSADLAIDGKRYSRALQAFTTHYYRVQCANDTVEGSFQTNNIPLGSTYLDFAPYNPEKLGALHSTGYYAWPTWDDTPRQYLPGFISQQRVIDPYTGILIRRVTLPGDHIVPWDLAPTQKVSSVADPDQAWTTPENVIDNDSNSAVSNGGTHPLLMIFKMPFVSGSSSLDTLKVVLNGSASGALSSDRSVDVCLMVDGANCATGIVQAVLPKSTGQTIAATGNGTLSDWVLAGEQALDSADIKTFAGTVNTSDSTVTWASGDYFSMHWSSASSISVNGSVYTIDHVISPKTLALTTSAGAQTGVAYTASNFGIRLVKTTDSQDKITLQEVELQASNSASASWPSGQNMNMCTEQTTQDSKGNSGYHCANFATGTLYWINPKTGESRLVAPLQLSGNSVFGFTPCIIDSFAFDADDPNSFYCLSQLVSDTSKPVFVKATYAGDESAIPGNIPDAGSLEGTTCNLRKGGKGPCGTSVSLSGDLRAELSKFTNNAFEPSVWPGFSFVGSQGPYLFVQAPRAAQDTDAWLLVFDITQKKIIAATNTYSTFPMRWGGIHTIFIHGKDANPWINLAINGAGFFTKSAGNAPSKIPQISAGSGDCPAGSKGCDLITIDHEPQLPNGTTLQPIAVKDIICLSPNPSCRLSGNPGIDEWVSVVARNGQTLTVQRAIGNSIVMDWTTTNPLYFTMMNTLHPLDTQGLVSSVNGWWNFLEDPHGTNATGKTILPDPTLFSHVAFYKNTMIQDGIVGVEFRKGKLPDSIGAPFTVQQPITPPFAGAVGAGLPSMVESHPTVVAVPAGENWGLDGGAFRYGAGQPWNTNSVTAIEGSLYKIGMSDTYLNRKVVPTFASCGTQPLKDISSAAQGDIISGTQQDWFKYCMADAGGECRHDSAAGEVFINCPLYGYGAGTACPPGSPDGRGDMLDICLANNMPPTMSIVQIGSAEQDNTGRLRRVLVNAGSRLHQSGDYWTARSLPDASWILFPLPTARNRFDVFLAKLPPYPAPDSTTRSDFIQVQLDLTPPSDLGVDNAVIEFGYAENGPADAHFCTSRQETCIKGDQAGTYGFAKDNVPGVACSGGCSIAIPAAPTRILYYQVKYRDSSNNVVYAADPAVFATP